MAIPRIDDNYSRYTWAIHSHFDRQTAVLNAIVLDRSDFPAFPRTLAQHGVSEWSDVNSTFDALYLAIFNFYVRKKSVRDKTAFIAALFAESSSVSRINIRSKNLANETITLIKVVSVMCQCACLLPGRSQGFRLWARTWSPVKQVTSPHTGDWTVVSGHFI